MPKPFAVLDANGSAPVLSYNVPAPTSYSGRSYTELDFGGVDVFKDTARHRDTQPDDRETPEEPGQPSPGDVSERDPELIDPAVRDRLAVRLDKLAKIDVPIHRLNELLKEPQLGLLQSEPVLTGPTRLQTLIDEVGRDAVVEQLATGGEFVERSTALGNHTKLAISQPTSEPVPRLALVEVYRLSSYLANYGAGRTVSTFTLLPGEEMTIHVKTYRHFSQALSRAESILDSFSSSSEQEFASTLQQENTAKGSEQGQFSWHAEGQAEGTWGWGSAKVSGGVAGSSNSSRETFAKTVSTATAKHVAKASASRDVEINTSSETKTEQGEETATERRIRNINLSRTLNFVFRQMNQEFVTLLHLVDARVAFHNGSASSYREVSLAQLDDLLGEVISDGSDGSTDHTDLVRQAIVAELSSIVDYQDFLRSYVEEFQPRDGAGEPVGRPYLRARRDLVSSYDAATGSDEIRVPGIILAAQTNVLRTDGVVVEALLGQGEALDEYSRGLQREAVRTQRVRNAQAEAEVDRQELANRIVIESPDRLDAFTKVNPDHQHEALVVPHSHVVPNGQPH
jgi:hypothetical protein